MKRIRYFIPERNGALVRAFRMAAAMSPALSMPRLAEIVVASPAPRFFISEEHATVVMSRLLRGRPLPPSTNPTRMRIYRELFRRLSLRLPLPPHMRLFDVMAEIVNSPAPEFYISPQYALKILNNANIRYNRR